MAESQSRYGIMKDLTDRKTTVKQEIATMEAEYENTVVGTERQMAATQQEIERTEATYESDFRNWKRIQEMEIGLEMKKHDRKLETLQAEIETKETTYESDFEKWRDGKERDLENSKENFGHWKKTTKAAVTAKQGVLEELDLAMQSLKDISKESSSTD